MISLLADINLRSFRNGYVAVAKGYKDENGTYHRFKKVTMRNVTFLDGRKMSLNELVRYHCNTLCFIPPPDLKKPERTDDRLMYIRCNQLERTLKSMGREAITMEEIKQMKEDALKNILEY